MKGVNKTEYKVGDVVEIKKYDEVKNHKCISECSWVSRFEKPAVITRIECGNYRVCDLWIPPEAIKCLSGTITSKILITSDGTTTTARLYDGKKVSKTAEAKCNPDDKFDFATGAKLAFDRLMGTGKPTYYNGKVVCVDDSTTICFTKGMVYEFKDGFVRQNGGSNYDRRRMRDWNDIQTLLEFVKFIEFKGEADER